MSFRNLISTRNLVVFAGFSIVLWGCNLEGLPGFPPGTVITIGNPPPGAGSPGAPKPPPCHAAPHQVGQDDGPYMAPDAPPGSLKRLHGHVPRALKARKVKDKGKMKGEEEMSVTVALALNHENELDRELANFYDPTHPRYHQFLTPAEFRSRYAPTEDQVNQVQAFLQAEGFHSISVNENRMFVKAQAPVKHVNAAFHTVIHQYEKPIDNGKNPKAKAFFAPAFEVQVPANLPVIGVHGLENMFKLKPHYRELSNKRNLRNSSGLEPMGGPAGFNPANIRSGYRIPSNLNGAGQTLALFQLDGFSASDIKTYEKTFGLPDVPLQTVLIDGVNGSPGPGAAEVTLDIELMIAVAPGAKKIIVYEGQNTEQGILNVYAKIANDNASPNVSTSWGATEDEGNTSFMRSENAIFKQMAAQGQSIYAASGDEGAYDDGQNMSVDDPGSQPYIVSVGGTALSLHPDGSYDSETVWNSGDGIGGQGGGGGVSSLWTMPNYQVGLNFEDTKGSKTMRNTPDVALNSDPNTGYSIFYGGRWTVFGGTSCAAPLWAAFTALVNQQRAAQGQSVLGFPNPIFYQIGKSARYGADFHDIADGSTNMYYPAVKGFDNSTGWGSLIGENLLADLTEDRSLPPASPSPSPTPVSPIPWPSSLPSSPPLGGTNPPPICDDGSS